MAGTRERSRAIFSKKLKQTILHPLPTFLHCSFTSHTKRTFVALQFADPMTQKSFNLVKE